MSNFLNIHTPYIDSKTMDRLMSIATNSPVFTASGANSKCFVCGDYAILKTGNIEGHTNNFDQIINDLNNLRNEGVNVARILGYAITEHGKPYYDGSRYDKGFIVQEKAPGRELLDARKIPTGSDAEKNTPENRQYIIDYCTMLRDAPQEHFDKFISDLKAISDKKIAVDASKLTNFFYDSEKGFTFIDLNFRSEEKLFDRADLYGQQTHREFLRIAFAMLRYLPLQNYSTGDPIYTDKETEHIKFCKCLAFEKLSAAATKIGIPPSDIENLFREQSTSSDTDRGFELFDFTSPEEITQYLDRMRSPSM